MIEEIFARVYHVGLRLNLNAEAYRARIGAICLKHHRANCLIHIGLPNPHDATICARSAGRGVAHRCDLLSAIDRAHTTERANGTRSCANHDAGGCAAKDLRGRRNQFCLC